MSLAETPSRVMPSRSIRSNRWAGEGWNGIAVVEDDARPRRQGHHQPVPHHPPAGGEVEDPVAGADVQLELMFLHELEHHPRTPVDHALGRARCARGVENEQRMVETEGLGGKLGALAGGQEVVPRDGAGDGRRVGFGIQVGDDHHLSHRRQRLSNLSERRHPIEGLAAVGIAVGGQQEHGVDLAEAVHHPRHAEVGGGGTEHRADGGGGDHQHHRLGPVGHPGRHPVAGAHPVSPQGGRRRSDLGAQPVPGQVPGVPVLAPVENRRRVTGRPPPVQQVPGHAQPAVGKETGVDHRVARREDPLSLLSQDAHVVPGGVPEPGDVLHAPAVQFHRVGDPQPVPPVDLPAKRGHRRSFDPPLRRAPRGVVRPWIQEGIAAAVVASAPSVDRHQPAPPRAASTPRTRLSLKQDLG